MAKIVISAGDKYGKLTVIRELPKVKTPTTQYRLFECQCECGNVVTISMNALRTTKKESKCPECRKKAINPGDRFNRLVVLQEIEPIVRVFKGKGKAEGSDRTETYRRFSCLCDCGEICVKRLDALTRNVVTCGCLAGEVNSVNNRTHGMKKAPEYKIWLGIKQRCYNPNDANYYNYGQRGIRVSDDWLDSFEAFYRDMGKRPEDGKYSIERLNVNGNYCKENCVWATAYEQNRNRRDNHFVTYKGETLCLVDWAEKLGIHRNRFLPMFSGSISGYNKMTDEEIIAHLVEHGDTLGRKFR